MNTHDFSAWLLFIAGGYLSGGIMFSRIVPSMLLKSDICKMSDDGNPGAANVFHCCGVPLGILCLFLDMAKGFLPIFFAVRLLDPNNIFFSAVIAAPVLGHATAPFNRGRGGKCIATAFGEMLALIPVTWVVLILAGLYIFFSVAVKIDPIRRRSIVTFILFGAASGTVLAIRGFFPIAAGCVIISAITVFKHLKCFCPVPENSVANAAVLK